MNKHLKIVLISFLFFGFLIQAAKAYEIPPRKIEVKPYLNIMFPHDLLKSDDGGNIVKNKAGFGIGARIRNQIHGSFGFIINFSFTDLEVTDNSLSTVTIFTGGGYFARETGIGDFTIDCEYGIISVGDFGRSLFMPGLEYSRHISERTTFSAGFDWVIPNDWFYYYSVKTNYGSFSFSLGAAIIF